MTTLTSDASNAPVNTVSNNSIPIILNESDLRLPLDSSLRILFTGYFNGFGIEVTLPEEMALLHHSGCFGKGSYSRSKPRFKDVGLLVMRKRQFMKRMFWYQKFLSTTDTMQSDDFLKDVDALTTQIVNDKNEESNKDVIDLVSSDEERFEEDMDVYNGHSLNDQYEGESVVIVPNSDSEGENYFENLRPKCCINRIKINEKLMLSFQEAFFLVYGIGCLQVFDNDKLLTVEQCWSLFMETDVNFLNKYIVYHYYRSKGYVVKPGIKFGGDYLLYKEGPEVSHADYIVLIKNDNILKSNWLVTLGHVRMASTTSKEIILVEVIKHAESEEQLPKSLNCYKLREIFLNRNIPIIINDND